MYKSEIVAFDLDSLAQLKDRFLCIECLVDQSPYRQSKTIQVAQQKFKEMTMNEFNDKKNQITSNLDKLQNDQLIIKRFQEYFTNKISESIKILIKRISGIQNELKTLIESSFELQSEQNLIDLSNYVNFGFYKNHNNQMNPNNYQFIEQIQNQLDYSKFQKHLISIQNSLESIYKQSLIDLQVKLIPLDQISIDLKKHTNLRYQCQKHKSKQY